MLQDIIVLMVKDMVHILLLMDTRLINIHRSPIHPHTRLLVDILLLVIHPTGAIPLLGILTLEDILIQLVILTIHLPIIQAICQIWDS